MDERYTLNFSGDELTVLLKCIKAALGMEPLKDWYKEIAPELYDRMNQEWHDQTSGKTI